MCLQSNEVQLKSISRIYLGKYMMLDTSDTFIPRDTSFQKNRGHSTPKWHKNIVHNQWPYGAVLRRIELMTEMGSAYNVY